LSAAGSDYRHYLLVEVSLMATLDVESVKFDSLVADALEHLWDFSYLGNHALVELEIVKRQAVRSSDSTHLDEGRALSDLLQAAIEDLKPAKRQRDISRERMFSTILYQAYVEGIPNTQIAEVLNIGERTFYRYKRKAIRVVAQLLRDWEG
jgi:hypothetical protein